jgi:hypothetical protein
MKMTSKYPDSQGAWDAGEMAQQEKTPESHAKAKDAHLKAADTHATMASKAKSPDKELHEAHATSHRMHAAIHGDCATGKMSMSQDAPPAPSIIDELAARGTGRWDRTNDARPQ